MFYILHFDPSYSEIVQSSPQSIASLASCRRRRPPAGLLSAALRSPVGLPTLGTPPASVSRSRISSASRAHRRPFSRARAAGLLCSLSAGLPRSPPVGLPRSPPAGLPHSRRRPISCGRDGQLRSRRRRQASARTAAVLRARVVVLRTRLYTHRCKIYDGALLP
jgi:hypothetical protein